MTVIDDIASVNRYLNMIVGIIFFIFGIVGSLANLALFTRRRLLSNPCSQYILVASILDLVLLITNLSSRIATEGFGVNSGFLFTVGVCKIRTWIVPWLGLASLTCKALSSFDQWACTSRSTNLRKWSSVKRARLLAMMTIVVWSLPSVPFMVYMDMVKKTNGLFVCTNTSQVYALAFAYFINPVLLFLVPLILLFYFGYRAYRNMHVLITRTDHRYIHRLGRQLRRMIIIQAIVSALSTIPFGTQYIYSAATMNVIKDAWRTAQESLFFTLSKLSFYVSSIIPFYIYIALSSDLRSMIRDLLLCRLRNNRVGNGFTTRSTTMSNNRQTRLNTKTVMTMNKQQIPTIA